MSVSVPPSGPLVDWLRDQARQPFIQARGDEGDQIPLQWLVPLVDSDSRIPAAIGELLGEGEPIVTARLLAVAAAAGSSTTFRGLVARAIGKDADVLARTDVGDAQSALGLAVYALWPPVPMADDTLQALQRIQRREDGWPLSLRTGIAIDFPRFASDAVPGFDRMTDREQHDVMRGLLQRADERTVLQLFGEIARDGTDVLKRRVAAATKATLDELDRARRFASSSGAQLPGDPGSARWPRLAAALGVHP